MSRNLSCALIDSGTSIYCNCTLSVPQAVWIQCSWSRLWRFLEPILSPLIVSDSVNADNQRCLFARQCSQSQCDVLAHTPRYSHHLMCDYSQNAGNLFERCTVQPTSTSPEAVPSLPQFQSWAMRDHYSACPLRHYFASGLPQLVALQTPIRFAKTLLLISIRPMTLHPF